ncbi:MAG: radical SAM protein, partial [Zestosphaera sp.]
MTLTGGSVVKGGVKYVFIRASSALSRSSLPDLDYALNPYVGCYHKCRYCYARSYCRYEEPRTRWGDVIYVKGNVVNLLRGEVRRLRAGAVGVSTVTDPYQPIDALTGITRKCIDLLLKSGFRVVIQTKSPLVLRDLDLLKLRPDLVEVGFTITSLDDHLVKGVEVRAPPPSARVNALRRVAEVGVRTWVFLGPIIPGLNDDLRGIERVIDVAQETNSTLYYDWLRFRDELDAFFKSIGLSPTHYVRQSRYSEWRRVVEEGILRICRDKSVVCKPAFT